MKVRFWRSLFCVASLLVAACSAMAQDASVEGILTRYNEIRPTVDELVMYQLDWAPSLNEALERAEREDRPICLIVIHAQYGDIFSGHC